MESRQRSPTPLLKTCRTCAHAKIKCDRTQDPSICDRCLRLGKECTYANARGRKPPGPRPRSNKQLQIPERPAPSATGSPSASESIASEQSQTPPHHASSSGTTTASQQPPRPSLPGYAAGAHDPFKTGQLSLEKGQELLDRFRTRLTPHFPFVIIADSEHVSTLRQTRPALCLALLAAASHDDVRLQRALGQMFNELVAARLVSGNFTCLDVLQGLLVHLAWAHFQPRPKRYSQHLHLAISIVSDLRLDRPKNPRRWNIEEIDDVVKNESVLDPMQIHASVSDAKESVAAFKNSLTFPLSDCPLLVPQMHTIQLCLNQLSLPEAPFGLTNPQNDSLQRLITGLSESTVSAKSLISVLLHTPPGQEVYFPNIIWVMLHCGLTLAARLDLLVADPRIAFMAEHLRQFSDIGHTIRQVVLRLESTSSPNVDDRGDRDSFYHFAIRAKRVEQFYLQQQNQSANQQLDFLPQTPHVTVPTTTAGFTPMSTPGSEFSIHSQSLDYSLPPSMFAQPAAPTDGNAYPNFIPPNPRAMSMSSASTFSMDTLSFLPESFIPFRGWDLVLENLDGAGL
ncbi:hypothetical protein LZ31DRAFT_543106 [Colletotrichum somersetense]|nr:hypothetical protein LZ31DRAFT_543106 [Colletotrichum somersetense]